MKKCCLETIKNLNARAYSVNEDNKLTKHKFSRKMFSIKVNQINKYKSDNTSSQHMDSQKLIETTRQIFNLSIHPNYLNLISNITKEGIILLTILAKALKLQEKFDKFDIVSIPLDIKSRKFKSDEQRAIRKKFKNFNENGNINIIIFIIISYFYYKVDDNEDDQEDYNFKIRNREQNHQLTLEKKDSNKDSSSDGNYKK